MAEYSSDIPVAAEKPELDFPANMEKHNLNISVIPEHMEPEDGNTRGNSAGKTGGTNGKTKALRNYLTSPTGSCHDICKYGRKLLFEKKVKRDRKISREGGDLKQTVLGQKKKPATCLKPSPHHETQLPNKPLVMRDVWSLVKNVVAASQQISSCGKHNNNLKLKTIQTKPSGLPAPGFLSNKRNSITKITQNPGVQPASPVTSPTSRSNHGSRSLNGSLESGKKTGIGSGLGSPRSGRNSGIGSVLGSPRSGRNSGIGSALGSPRSGRNSGIGSALGSPRSGRNSGIGSSLRGPRSGKNTGIGSGKDRATTVTGEKKVSAAPSAKKVANIKTRNSTNVKGVSQLKNHSNTRRTGFEHPSNEHVPEKILHVIEPKVANKTMGTTQNGLQTARSPPSFEHKSSTFAKRGTHVTHLASSPVKKNQRQAQAGAHASRSPPSTSPPSMNKSSLHTRKGIHKKRSSVSSLSSLSSISSVSSVSSVTSPSESIESEDSGTISEHSATEIACCSEEEYKRSPRRVEKISSGEEDDSPQELRSMKERGLYEAESRKRSFKRTEPVHIDLADEFEKVVLSHPDVESNKGNQTSLDNMIEEAVLKHLDVENKKDNQSFINTMIEEVVLRHYNAEDIKDNQSFLNSMIEEVVLKHHDPENKKENSILFNNMIEQTANKLVQARKSKVKALVGAFESLISLQDTPSLATTRAH